MWRIGCFAAGVLAFTALIGAVAGSLSPGWSWCS